MYHIRTEPEEGVTRSSDSIKGTADELDGAIDAAYGLQRYTGSAVIISDDEHRICRVPAIEWYDE